jgi:exopolysaccharide production protein ExoY
LQVAFAIEGQSGMGSVPESGAIAPAVKQNESSLKRSPNTVERSTSSNTRTLDRAVAAAQRSTGVIGISLNGSSQPIPVPVGGRTKRAFDVVVAGTTLLLMAPLMVIIAGIIVATMGRPVLFVQQRVGFNGKVFGRLKFRTMTIADDAPFSRYLQHRPDATPSWAETHKSKDDPRVSWFGHILRRSRLDQLPQLFNVLRGEMSCVGPRPVPIKELFARYGLTAHDYARARPGLIGMWQIQGGSSTHPRRVAYDRIYVRRWSLLLDMNILFRGLSALITESKIDPRRSRREAAAAARTPARYVPTLSRPTRRPVVNNSRA